MGDKSGLSGLILEGTRFEGKLSFDQKMRIDGEFVGEMTSRSQLIVGKSAKINADIKVKEISVMGEIQGTISECDLLQIHEGGRVLADLEVKSLDIKPGALFDGKCKMVTDNNSQNERA
jgi:cytoskeletal protein CcmA (bactofilin family)